MLIITSIAAIFFGLSSDTYNEFSNYSNGVNEYDLVFASPCSTGKKQSGFAIAPNNFVLLKQRNNQGDLDEICKKI